MTIKKHLTAQEEAVSESGIQLRSSDPVSPQEDLLWLNKTDGTIKHKSGGTTYVLAKGKPATFEVPGTEIDGSKSDTYRKTISSSITFSIINFPTGFKMELLVENINISAPVTVGFGDLVFLDEDENGIIPALQKKLYTIVNAENGLFIRSSLYVG